MSWRVEMPSLSDIGLLLLRAIAMGVEMVSEQMRRFSDINWSKITGTGMGPIDLCLNNNIPVYFKVRRDRQLVYRHYRAGQAVRFLPLEEFNGSILFLRLDSDSLREISAAGHCIVTHFSGDGLCITEQGGAGVDGLGKNDKISALMDVESDYALLVDKKRWEKRGGFWPNPLIPPVGSPSAPEDFVDEVEVGKNDLWFSASDIDALKQCTQDKHELIDYPFEHKGRVPRIYWMFQAAYALNHLGIVAKGEVGDWLGRVSDDVPYRYKSIRTAEKFVWLALDRAKGGANRGDFVLDDLEEFGDRRNYQFPFVSEGLSFILAIAEWWIAVDGNKLDLAKKLDAHKFSGLEIGDLVYLISGSQIGEDDVLSFYSYKVGRSISIEEVPSLVAKKRIRPIFSGKLGVTKNS